MGALALGLAGAGAGSFLGVGPGVGFAAGTMLGGLLFPDPPVKQEGPRLEDLRVTSSAYGIMRPILYARVPVAGNIFDASMLYETKHKEKTGGGKGGGGPTVEQTTYTYSVDLAVGLGEGPISGVEKIYANEKLIYDASPTAAVARPDWLKFAIYLGDETQDADPTLEAIHGVGEVPGYRGEAYIVFERFQLQDFGNRPPQFRFIVVVDGSLTNGADTITDSLMSNAGGLVKHPNTGVMFIAGNGAADINGRAYNPFTKQPLFSIREGTAGNVDNSNEVGFLSVPYVTDGITYELGANRHFYIGTGTINGHHSVSLYDAYTGGFYGSVEILNMASDDNTPLVAVNENSGEFYRLRIQNNFVHRLYHGFIIDSGIGPFDQKEIDSVWVPFPEDVTNDNDWKWHADTVATDKDGTLAILALMSSTATEYFVIVRDERIRSRTTDGISGYNNASNNRMVFDSGRQLYWMIGEDAVSSSLIRFTAYSGGGSYVETHTGSGSWALIPGQSYDPISAGIWLHRVTTGTLYWFDTATGEFNSWTGFETHGSWAWGGVEYHAPTGTAWGANNNEDKISLMRPDQLSTDVTALDDVVADIFTRCGLVAADYDVSDLAGITVKGFRIARRATGRSAIDSLRAAYVFDIVDTGAKLKCVRRGNTSALTLDEDDLGAQEGIDAKPILKVQRADEMDVPQEITLTYMNLDAEYRDGSQYARRLAGNIDNVRDLRLPVVFSDDEAAQLADVLLRAGAIESETYIFDTHLGYIALEGADVLTLQDGDDEFTARVLDITMEGPILHVNAAREFDIYTSSVLGAPSPIPDSEVAYYGSTILLLLDIPLLREADNDAGFYVAASSYADGWPGCAVFRSTDNTVYEYLQGIGSQATFGFVSDASADGPDYKWDENLSLVVRLTSGTLSSVTEDQALQEQNVFLWGAEGRWELGVFQVATDNGGGEYTLTRILRGLRGTNHAMDQHQAGDRFLLLESTTLERIAVEAADINSPRYFKGVTFGDTLDASTSAQHLFAPQAVALKPWAPVHIQITGFGGDITIAWKRQDRIKAAPFQQPQMSESAESYEVDIMSGTTVKRTLAGGSETVTYTSAQQTTDFGGLVTTLEINAYQLSSVVDRGYPANATV